MSEEKIEKVIHIAIVGKPNVGKSTLFNRIIGKRKSITDARSGTTRDRLYERVSFRDKEVLLIDTGGIQYERSEALGLLVDREVNKAIVDADVVIFVCEKDGLTAIDYQLGEDIRRRNKKVILVANKVDNPKNYVPLNEFYKLGFGEPIAISAIHGLNIGALIDTMYAHLPAQCSIPAVRYDFNLAIAGEPNTGKSTLLNAFLKSDRVLVSDVPGTTRDTVEADFECNGMRLRIVDTAGIKKKQKMKTPAAIFSLFRTEKSIKKADVVFLLIDAEKGPQKNTRAIYKTIRDYKKACIILVNKWDVTKGVEMDSYKKRLIGECGFLHNTPVCFISALTGRNVDDAMQAALRVWGNYTTSIPTKELNHFIEDVKRYTAPPPTVKFKYMVQVNVKPPTFIIFVKNKRNIKQNYMNYLTNQLVDGFELTGVIPILILKEEKK